MRFSTEADDVPAIDRTKTTPLLTASRDAAATAKARGSALESYIAELFSQLPGLRVSARNSLNAAGSQEIDIAFWNDKDLNGLYFIVDNCFLVESKNTAQPTSAAEIREFTTKLRDRGRRFGIFIAANGITGARGHLRQARDAVSRALRDGIELLVFTIAELEALGTTDDFVRLVQDKIGLLFATESSI